MTQTKQPPVNPERFNLEVMYGMYQTGIGALELRRPKVRDRTADAPDDQKVRFTSSIRPKWARRSPSLDALLPVLYLRGISTGDFQEALSALLGPDAANLSPNVISRLTAGWQKDYYQVSLSETHAATHPASPPNHLWSPELGGWAGRRGGWMGSRQ